MPSVHKRARSRFWSAAFTLPDGARCLRSTKTADKSRAIQIALGWQRVADSKNAKDQAAKVLSDIVKVITGEGVEKMTAKQFAVQWLEQKALEGAGGTHARYRVAVTNFNTCLSDHATLADISANLLTTWRNSEAKRTSISTANLQIKIIRMMLKEAKILGFVSDNLAAMVRPLTVDKSIAGRRPFTRTEARKLLTVTPAESEWRGMNLFGLYTGQRLGDVARISARDIEGGVWKVRTTKTGLTVRIPLAPPLLVWLSTSTEKGPLFPRAAKIAATGKVGTLSNQFYELLVKAELAPPRPHASKGKGRSAGRTKSDLSFHSLRHTLTTWLEEAGISKAVAMEFVGHESESINQSYTHTSLASLAHAATQLPDVT
jgi:integrase